MEDLHVHDVSEEASSATLGAMLPQVPPDKTIIKKKEGIDDMIPEELMEFIYNEDATYTYAVEGAISNLAHNVKDKFSNSAHAKDLKANSLPFKVRQLTIERATLRAKISWMGKRKSKQEKVLKYKKRLVEVEQALRRIQNTVNSADEKKQIEAQIKELDMQVTKSVTTDLEQRGVLEAVNEIIRTGKEEGTVVSEMHEFTREDFFESGDAEFEVMTEGANYKVFSSMKSSKKKFKKLSRQTKKAIRAEKYDEASKYLTEMSKEIAKVKREVKLYPEDELNKNFIGMLAGWCLFDIKLILQGLGLTVAAVAGAAVSSPLIIAGAAIANKALVLVNLYHTIEKIAANLKDHDGDVSLSVINGIYNRCLVCIDDMEKHVNKLAEVVKEGKAAKEDDSEKDTKESVKLAVQAFEAGYLTESEFLDLIVEAKKPDDGMMPILSKLHDKGYKTKYSCTGHKDSGSKDRNDDGIVNGKLASFARIMFNGDYDFPDPPKHWGFKTVDGKDYLYVLQFSNNGKNPDAFDEWKNKYMASLDRWVDSLPNAKKEDDKVVEDTPSEDKKDQSNEVKESVDFDAVIDNEMAMLMMDLSNNF